LCAVPPHVPKQVEPSQLTSAPVQHDQLPHACALLSKARRQHNTTRILPPSEASAVALESDGGASAASATAESIEAALSTATSRLPPSIGDKMPPSFEAPAVAPGRDMKSPFLEASAIALSIKSSGDPPHAPIAEVSRRSAVDRTLVPPVVVGRRRSLFLEPCVMSSSFLPPRGVAPPKSQRDTGVDHKAAEAPQQPKKELLHSSSSFIMRS
jgi:hypothetical protein